VTTRLATSNDTRELANVLARAFEHDPIYLWSFGESNLQWSRRFFRWQLRRLMPQRVTWTTPERGGAAVWALPDQWRETTAELLRLIVITTPAIRRRLRTVVAGLTLIDERHPVEPHLYLALLGVEPRHQGRGIGSSLLAPGLERCDREGLPAYLETGRERNVDFYARHGFVQTGRVDVPDGPPVWTLWREPR
jgi:GNAT superfamily N-acetyltransferase